MKQTAPSRWRKVFVALAVASLALIPVSAAHAAVVDVNFQPVAFNNNAAIGTGAPAGFTHRYVNAITVGGQQIDAILTVVSKTSGATVSDVDRTINTTFINTYTSFAGSSDSVTYRIDFVEGGTSTPIALQNIAINVKDVDLRQFVQFAGIGSYYLKSPTNITAQTTADVGTIPAGAYRFQSTSGSSDAADQPNWVEVRYAQADSIGIILGATQSGPALFDIDFSQAAWTSPVPTPVTPAATAYTVTYDKNSNTATGLPPGATTGTGSQTILGNTGNLQDSGFSFVGWNTQPDGMGVTYAPGSSITPTGNVTLFAMWTAAPTYTITYDGNSQSSGNPPASTTGSGSQAVPGNSGNLERPGFVFQGWNTQPNGTGVTYAPGSSITPSGNITLYAVWVAEIAHTGASAQVALAGSLGALMMGAVAVGAARARRNRVSRG